MTAEPNLTVAGFLAGYEGPIHASELRAAYVRAVGTPVTANAFGRLMSANGHESVHTKRGAAYPSVLSPTEDRRAAAWIAARDWLPILQAGGPAAAVWRRVTRKPLRTHRVLYEVSGYSPRAKVLYETYAAEALGDGRVPVSYRAFQRIAHRRLVGNPRWDGYGWTDQVSVVPVAQVLARYEAGATERAERREQATDERRHRCGAPWYGRLPGRSSRQITCSLEAGHDAFGGDHVASGGFRWASAGQPAAERFDQCTSVDAKQPRRCVLMAGHERARSLHAADRSDTPGSQWAW